MNTKNFGGLTVGMRVTYSGFEGTVVRLCEWSESMVEIRMARGVVCVTAHDVLPLAPAVAAVR